MINYCNQLGFTILKCVKNLPTLKFREEEAEILSVQDFRFPPSSLKFQINFVIYDESNFLQANGAIRDQNYNFIPESRWMIVCGNILWLGGSFPFIYFAT